MLSKNFAYNTISTKVQKEFSSVACATLLQFQIVTEARSRLQLLKLSSGQPGLADDGLKCPGA
jgi:hypothetical protein